MKQILINLFGLLDDKINFNKKFFVVVWMQYSSYCM